MFFAPSLIWRAVSSQNLDMGNIVEATTLSDAAIRPSERDEVVKNIALQMDRFLKNRRLDFNFDTPGGVSLDVGLRRML